MPVTVHPAPASGTSASLADRRPSGQVRPGRVWYTDFSDSTHDAQWLNVTNFTYGTDGSTPIVSLTTPGTLGTILTKQLDLRNLDMRMRFRAVAGSGFTIANIEPRLVARYLDASNGWYSRAFFAAGNPTYQPASIFDGATQFAAGSNSHDVTDATTYRWYRFRIIEDAVFSKWWFDGTDEPAAWGRVDRLRPPTGLSNATSTGDNTSFGACGLTLQYGGYVSDLSITELVRGDEELLWNGDLAYGVDTRNGLPLFWYKNPGTPDAGNSYSTPSVADRFGTVRPAMRVNAVTGEDLLWSQDLWTAMGGANAFLTRKQPMPAANSPAVIEVEVESSAVDVARATPGHGAIVVVYVYSQEGTVLNSGSNYATLGPNGVLGGGGTSGNGSWDNHVNRFRLQLTNGTPPERVRFMVGLHDSNVTGELTIHSVSARPVA